MVLMQNYQENGDTANSEDSIIKGQTRVFKEFPHTNEYISEALQTYESRLHNRIEELEIDNKRLKEENQLLLYNNQRLKARIEHLQTTNSQKEF